MRWLCWFSPCRWQHICNVPHVEPGDGIDYGLYQCARCKSLSPGSSR